MAAGGTCAPARSAYHRHPHHLRGRGLRVLQAAVRLGEVVMQIALDNPSPGLHLRCNIAEAFASAFF
jgi:hypothetical protein